MKKNMGSADKIIRILLAVLVAILYYTGTITGVWAIVLGIVAIVFLATSFINFCPLYTLLGISTGKNNN